MPSWGWFVVGGVFLLGVSIGFGVAALVAGTANSELAQHNYRLMRERDYALSTVTQLRRDKKRPEGLVNTVTEEAL